MADRRLAGLHATTWLAGELLIEALADLPGAGVLDVGAGTGILGALALDAGAARAVGVERDAALVASARALHPRLELEVADAELGLPGRFAIVVANLTDPPLRRLVPALLAAASAVVIVAGIRLWQGPALRRALERNGAREVVARARGAWCAYRGRVDAGRG